MSKYQRKIEVDELEEGMYVSKLDCPWHKTPFPLRGFHINSKEDIQSVKTYCKHVYVDVTRSRSKTPYQVNSRVQADKLKRLKESKLKSVRELVSHPVKYSVTSPLKKELKQAKEVYRDINNSIKTLAEEISQDSSVNLQQTVESSKRVVASIVRNPEAMIWVMKLKHNASDLYQHSINCAVWAAVLGREIGLTESKLENLTTGVMLSKIGLMMMTRGRKLDFVRFKQSEQYRKHVLLAIKLLSANHKINRAILEVVATQEERLDGSGFPNQLEGNQIPLFGQIAGLVDYYESATSPYFFSVPVSPTEALSELYHLKDSLFNESLVEAFIQALGLYPPGTIVLLNNEEVGIVTSNQRNKRLQPEIMLVLNSKKQPYRIPKTIDMQKHNQHKENHELEIVSALPVGSYGVQPHQYQYAHDSLVSRILG